MKVVLLGYGNVAAHLVRALGMNTQAEVVQIYNRTPLTQSELPPCTTELSEITEADVYIIAIPDDAISDFSASLPFTNKLVVHTSGSVLLRGLSAKNRRGIFYPLQSFTKNRPVDFTTIPICLEAERASDLKTLTNLAGSISEKVVEINSEKRRILHLGAVFVNNFTNHLYQISEEIIHQHGLDFGLLQPLILETAGKLQTLTPSEAQTGPALRKDTQTIQKHLALLKKEDHKEIYKILTHSIQKTHGKKL